MYPLETVAGRFVASQTGDATMRRDAAISLEQALAARRILRAHLVPTPLRRYEGLCRLLGAEVYVKHENHNPTGTFKIRGALNLMHRLARAGVKGVITYSTGNHGAAVASAARVHGLEALVVVPENSNRLKTRVIEHAGAELVEHGVDFEAAGRRVAELAAERGLYFVHPANEPHIINGVGTEFLEILEEIPDLDVMLVPLGAGSEAAAAITVLKGVRPQIAVIAVQAEAAPAGFRSWRAGAIVEAPNATFAGGMATGVAYEIPFAIYKDGLDDFVLLGEGELLEGMALAAHHTGNLAEGAGAACLRAAFKLRRRLAGKKVVLQMSGGNAAGAEIRKAMSLDCVMDGLPPGWPPRP